MGKSQRRLIVSCAFPFMSHVSNVELSFGLEFGTAGALVRVCADAGARDELSIVLTHREAPSPECVYPLRPAMLGDAPSVEHAPVLIEDLLIEPYSYL